MPERDDIDDVIARHRAGHEQHGTTYAVYFPPECPWEVYERLTDAMTDLAYGVEREGWDAFAFGRGGDCVLVEADEWAAASERSPSVPTVR